ncbi:MAG TPA: metallophosphoesterase family protein [Gemmatimonadaceae bacterium]|nr:metallophosphoesterase family protein [Gemmatimonadaceae bacterium]
MRFALISDIHANVPALTAVLADISMTPDVVATYHLGDLVGYAPWPNETIELLWDSHVAGVSGNYDSTVAWDYKHCGCKYEDPRQEELSHVSYEWTRVRISATAKRKLAALPFRIDIRPLGGHLSGPTLVLVHATPTLNTVYWTEDRSDSFCLKMAQHAAARAGDLICFGHTHVPWHRLVDGIHFVNTGSVGRPKDGDWRAGWVLIEVGDDGTVRPAFRRTAYDLDAAMNGIRESELPDDFADHLRTGGAMTGISAEQSTTPPES